MKGGYESDVVYAVCGRSELGGVDRWIDIIGRVDMRVV